MACIPEHCLVSSPAMGYQEGSNGYSANADRAADSRRIRRSILALLIACIGALALTPAADAWMDVDSPGAYTNDNTPLVKGDAEINFYAGFYWRTGCIPGTAEVLCIPYAGPWFSAGYTDVTISLYKVGTNHWCADVCATHLPETVVATPSPPIDDLTAYSEPYSYTAPKLADGKWKLNVIHYGEDAPSPKIDHQFFVDTRPPSNPQLTLTPPQYSNDVTPTFDWTADDPEPSSGLAFKCNLDGAGWEDCPNDKTFDTPEGNHTLQVKVADNAGNEDPTVLTYSWMVDTTPPALTINQPLSKGRYLLHQVPAADTDCTDPLSGGPPPVASGIATCGSTPINSEDLGAHKFTLSATDRAGNSSSKSIAYVVDPPDYGGFVAESHPLAYYRFNEALGSDTMVDSSGNHHDGIYQNGIALRRDGATACERRPHPPRVCELASPAENKAAFFPARDGHGYVNGITAPTTAYTMEAWVKPRDGADMMVMSHGGGGQLFIKDGKLAFRQVQDTIQSNAAVTPGVWSHVAATWNGSVTRLFVNGVQVASSTTANKAPSGTATFYVGYGEMAPWFHGEMDEAAYYDSALSQHRLMDRWKIGVAKDQPSVEAGNSILNTEGPFTDPGAPKNGGLYAPTKTPDANFACTDPDDLPGDSDVASCTAKLDGNPINSGDPLSDTLGPHTFTVTAVDEGGNVYTHNHTYTVKTFGDLFNTDGPIAYYRLGDASGAAMADSSGNGRNGEYKNDQDSGPVGISGDGDHARNFFGKGGYGYVNGIAAPRYQSTMEAWVYPVDGRDQSIVGHGDAGEIYIKDSFFRYRRMGETVTSSVPAIPGHWQQVVGTWDGVDLRIYVNGVETGKTESTKRPSSVSTFYVGFGELAPWFYGAIDEVAYYPTALNANRVYQHWLADPPPENLTDDPTGDAEPGNPGGTDPGTSEPGDPGSGDPDSPVTDDPSTGEPVGGEEPSTDPDGGETDSAGNEAKAGGKSGKRKAQIRKCKKISKKSKRKACLKRVTSQR